MASSPRMPSGSYRARCPRKELHDVIGARTFRLRDPDGFKLVIPSEQS